MPQLMRYQVILINFNPIMSQILLEIRQPTPLKTLVEISPVKKGQKISRDEIQISKLSGFRGEDIMGLSWIFLDPLEEEWQY